MIYLKKQGILFLKPKKVAGTSFEIALSRFAGKNDIITPVTKEDEIIRLQKGFPGPRNYHDTAYDILKSRKKLINFLLHKKRDIKYYNHVSAKLAKERLGARVFDSCYKISIARNPFDFFVSLYFWRTRELDVRPLFSTWARSNYHLLTMNNDQYYIDEELVIDQFISFESAAQDIHLIEQRFKSLSGLSVEFQSVSAKSGYRPKMSISDFYKNEPYIIETINTLSRKIIDDFGYKDPLTEVENR